MSKKQKQNKIVKIANIGEAAGLVWHHLNDNGKTSVATLTRVINLPRNTIDRALGWLDREGKIIWESKGNSDLVQLRSEKCY